MRVVLRRTRMDRLLMLIVSWLHHWVQGLAKAIWPGLFLPDLVVLKVQKVGWDEEFENERRMYNRLKPLQGTVIPTLNGETVFYGRPALVLSYIDGASLHKARHLEVSEVEQMLKDAYQALAVHGVVQEDINLDNFIVVDGRIVILDMEEMVEPPDADEIDFAAYSVVDALVYNFKLRKELRPSPTGVFRK